MRPGRASCHSEPDNGRTAAEVVMNLSCHPELGHVILSEAKDLVLRCSILLQEILRFAQDDTPFEPE